MEFSKSANFPRHEIETSLIDSLSKVYILPNSLLEKRFHNNILLKSFAKMSLKNTQNSEELVQLETPQKKVSCEEPLKKKEWQNSEALTSKASFAEKMLKMSLTSSSESRCFVGPGADDHNLQLLQLCKKMPGSETWLQIILIHTSSKCAINFHTSSFIILTRAESFMQRVLTRSSAAKWHCLFSEISEICSDISLQFSDFVNFFQHQKNV